MRTTTFEHVVMSPGYFEALNKDAARYRWLRDKRFLPGIALPWRRPPSHAEDLDAAIDNAMSKDER